MSSSKDRGIAYFDADSAAFARRWTQDGSFYDYAFTFRNVAFRLRLRANNSPAYHTGFTLVSVYMNKLKAEMDLGTSQLQGLIDFQKP